MIEIGKQDSIFDLVSKYPQVKKIMVELGFKDIVKPGMLQSAGRMMTISKGAKMKKIDMKEIENVFEQYGFLLKE